VSGGDETRAGYVFLAMVLWLFRRARRATRSASR
jgi:cbb3-type cytochrome oxidase subunit 3